MSLVLAVCIRHHQKHDYTNYDRFVPNLDMANKTTKRVSLPNLKSFEPTTTELRAKEVGDFPYVIWENGLLGIHLPTNMAATTEMYGDFQNFKQP